MLKSAAPVPEGTTYPPSGLLVPLRLDPVVLVGHVLDCPQCGRTRVQHGRFTCERLDAIAARVAYHRLPWRQRIRTRKPAGWGVVVVLALALVACSPAEAAAAEGETATVTKVVDGDTVHVDLAGVDTTVRLIGLDSPETKKPRTPVQCGGLAATDYAKTALLGKRVHLVDDPTQDRVDRYGRRLGYLRLPDGTDYSTEAVRAGVARAYTYDKPVLEHAAIQAAEDEARAAGRGGWASCGWSV